VHYLKIFVPGEGAGQSHIRVKERRTLTDSIEFLPKNTISEREKSMLTANVELLRTAK